MSVKVGWPWYAGCTLVWVIALIALPWLSGFDHSSLRVLAFGGALFGTMLLFVGIGFDVSERALGVLQSGRNTFSLSRLQMALWTWLIVSAIAAVAVCRAWGLFPGSDLAHTGSASTALNIAIPTDLFALMGISYFTGAAAPALLSLKSQNSNTSAQVNFAAARLGESIRATGRIFNRPSSAPPLIADLVQGDDLATAGTVDLSKVQQLLITLLLICLYGAMLFGMFGDGGATTTIKDVVMTQMPELSQNFVALLALSHAGYLAYKATPGVTPGSASASQISSLRPSPPDRN